MIPIERSFVQNYERGRRGLSPRAFVIHSSEGSFLGTKSWCNDLSSSVSYHFLIDTNGQILQMVDNFNTAWHAGLVKNSTWSLLKYGQNPNLYTIGIAYAGFAKDGPTFFQMVSIAFLLKEFSVIHSIPLDKTHVVPHNLIRTDKVCPGALVNFDALLAFARLT